MPNVRSQTVSRDGLAIVASDGRAFSITRAAVMAHFLAETGTRAQRRAKTIAWLKQAIESALGAEQAPARLLAVDFDDLDATRSMALAVGV